MVEIRDNFILKYRDWCGIQKRRVQNIASDHTIHINDVFAIIKEAKREFLEIEYVRKHKGIARQIGVLKSNLENVNKIIREQFIAGIFVGMIISILISLLFKYFGI